MLYFVSLFVELKAFLWSKIALQKSLKKQIFGRQPRGNNDCDVTETSETKVLIKRFEKRGTVPDITLRTQNRSRFLKTAIWGILAEGTQRNFVEKLKS